MSMVEPSGRALSFGVAGLGVAAAQIVPAIAKHPHLRVAAAAEPRQEARDKFVHEYGGEVFNTVEELCASPKLDAVYICTPNPFHAEHVLMAAKHGKHIIVEKPMGLSIEECEAMNAAVERAGVKLLCGHTHSFDAPIRKMHEIVRSRELGALCMINTWHYQDWLYRSRGPTELDPSLGGNVLFRQAPHAIDIVRLLGGGMVRSVRGMTGVWDPSRRAEGAWVTYIEFEDGTPATDVFTGYAHFDTAEFTSWIGEGIRPPDQNLRSRARIASLQTPEEEAQLKSVKRYGGGQENARIRDEEHPHAHFGITVVSCEHGDIRQSPHGLYIYGDREKWEVPVPKTVRGREAELEELYQAVVHDRPVNHDGRWGEATLEVVLGIMQSARERREVYMSHQVPSPDNA